MAEEKSRRRRRRRSAVREYRKVGLRRRPFNPLRSRIRATRHRVKTAAARHYWRAAARSFTERGLLNARDVRGVKALLSSVNFEFHFLSFGGGLEPIHADRGEVDEHVLSRV